MKVLLLEDNEKKYELMAEEVRGAVPDTEIVWVKNWFDYTKRVVAFRYDLILLDIMVPRSGRDPQVEDHHLQLAEATRSLDSLSFRTPAIVLTEYLNESEEFSLDLNRVDINVISFDGAGLWKDALRRKVLAAVPSPTFEVLIICALGKEAQAFESVADAISAPKVISGLLCREIKIGGKSGAVVLASRMGLVTASVTATLAIERFRPRLVCMSGICGGVPGEARIYDLLVSDNCHQHDVGKWSESGFKAEHYDVQIDIDVRNKLEEIIGSGTLSQAVTRDLKPTLSETPDGWDATTVHARIVPTSSGSAVFAEEGRTASLSVGQRKLVGFDMEVFAVYEAARLAAGKPRFFAVKAVVDDGDQHKGDRFHRVGCLLAARFVGEAIRGGIADC